jgi:TPR repeat protein
MGDQRLNLIKRAGVAVAAVALILPGISPLAGMDPADAKKATELYQKQDWNGLESLAARASRADPKDGWAWYNLGLAEDGLGRRDQAAAAYENSINLVPDYLRSSVVQLLAQDYVQLKQNGKLVALDHALQKSHPDLAQSLEAQYRGVLAAPAAPPAAVPEISPSTLQGMTANARRIWKSDAVPVMVNLSDIGRGFQVVFDFYSPSSRAYFRISQALGGTSNTALASANLSVAPIPIEFLPLDAAIARAREQGAPGTLDHAFLYRGGGGKGEPVDLGWDLAMKSDTVRGISIPAYLMPRERFERLLAAAQRGDANAQVMLSRVYTLGLAGPPDGNQAFKWCAQAATHGNVEGEDMLGQMYQFGRGVQANLELAARWYQAAANAGYAPAQYNLGLMYESGRGVPRNYTLAQQWISRAAHQGLGEAIGELPYAAAMARGEQRQAQAAAAKRPTRCQWSFQWYNPSIGMCVVSAVKLAPPSGGH